MLQETLECYYTQEFGRGGNGCKRDLYFNEYVDDKRLGLWLKSLFHFCAYDDTHEAIKLKVLSSYTTTWEFLYSTYHGKCLE